MSPGWANFAPGGGGYMWNKFARGPLSDATYQISVLQDLWFQTRFFFMFPYISLCKTCDPAAEPFSAPGA